LKNKVTYFLAFAASLLVLTSCGVNRKNVIAKKYHNTTTYFNYLYNGEVIYKEGVKQINAAYLVPPDGYIPVWYAGTEEQAKTYGTNFEKAIEKCEVALQKHNHKDNHYFDDLRFLIGRSWFYKRNYTLAIKNFEYVIKTYPESKIIPDVYLWMVKAHFMDDNGTMATKILEEKLSKLPLKKRHYGELALLKAQMNLEAGKYEEVVRILNSSKESIRGATNKARAHFLLGQIYQDQKSTSRAYENYKRVTKTNTDYELIFNAKLNMAKLLIESQDGTADNAKLRRLLKKMLRDEKNVDYKDRVYYEIAMLDLKTGNRPGAIENLKASIAANTGNQRQKALSYYKVGQIYFYEIKDFPMAQVYFDSASIAITRDAPEFREISTISATLKEFVGFTKAITLQDSLLRLSKLSDKALDAFVDNVIADEKKRKEESDAKQLEELNRLNDPNLFNQSDQTGSARRGNEFYFDSPDLVNSGRMEFEQRWGPRKNEDNWRRKTKATQVGDIAEEGDGENIEVNASDVEKYGSKEKARMIKMVPRNEEERAAAEAKLVEAMYGLGQVYATKLNIPDSAIAVYTRLITRFPAADYALRSQYALYVIYKDKGEISTAQEIADKICRTYPTSRYCRYCRGEKYEEESKSMFEDFASAYAALLETYQRKDYATCVDFSNFIAATFPNSAGTPEVLMIRGKAYGFTGQRDSLKTIYTFIKANFPDSDVIPEVTRTLQLMDGGKTTETNGFPRPREVNTGLKGSGENVDPRFTGLTSELKPGEKVFVVMLVKKEKIANDKLQIKINDFHAKFFQADRLNVSVLLYKNEYHLPYITQFDDWKAAMAYIRAASQEEELSNLFTQPEEKMMVISAANFRTAYGKKRMEDYAMYYETVLLELNQ
jgi:TolA-binding protein